MYAIVLIVFTRIYEDARTALWIRSSFLLGAQEKEKQKIYQKEFPN